jgi:AbrB family looped-hinge helix DNA binding protein
MRVSTKGQVTVPAVLRERYGIALGSEVDFLSHGDWLQIRPRLPKPKATSVFDDWLAKAAGSAKTHHSTDELMAISRGEDELDGAH